ncbi:alpha-farnesene synthase [Ricinus communis]|uniref:alpha-farnesene synthase n=1 Tax=Ricinus communis TaxID=3988 RepID=UPI00022CCE7B|nr:alpha-farnesene synthase [Ricinus communis]AEQ27768.1 alpha-farnesene synthase [Ricinus communis]|eukprot:NP_001310649.1 alpha-farnesene synthase [Ricinus communis]
MKVGQPVLQCQTNSEAFGMMQERRSGNYKPNIWKYDFLQSLSSKYDEEKYKTQAERLKEDAKHLFIEAVDLQGKLELVDCIIKVGLASHFKDEIKKALDTIASSIKNDKSDAIKNRYVTALCFRLLRQHGYEVSQDVFSDFLDENGTFLKAKSMDVKGVLELFEASYLALESENILDDAKAFSTTILKDINSATTESNLYKQVVHALELPFHWRVRWFDVKWHIKTFQKDKSINKTLLDLAKVNFNVVQATLQNDLKEISRWWRNLGLIENLKFSRDRLVESFLCTVGLVFEPQYSSFRRWLTKVVIMILVIDDVYDIYGSLEELQHFTNAINRWDTAELEQLPEYMKICFKTLHTITGETAHEMQREKRWDQEQTETHLKKVWADFCQALFVEAKWFNKGYTPSVQEYLKTACISSSGSLLSVHSFFLIMNEGTREMLHFLEKNQEMFYNISLIIRLCNDLGTSVAEQERGDAASSIVCHMREMEVLEEEARSYLKGIIGNYWKKVNEKCFTQSPEMQLFININVNMARVVHNLYQNRDGFGVQDHQNKKQILSLLVHPFKLD